MFVGFVEENEEELLLVELVEFGFGGEEENAFDGGEQFLDVGDFVVEESAEECHEGIFGFRNHDGSVLDNRLQFGIVLQQQLHNYNSYTY